MVTHLSAPIASVILTIDSITSLKALNVENSLSLAPFLALALWHKLAAAAPGFA